MSKKVNVVLARHHAKDICRVFQVPDGVTIEPFEVLMCDTAIGKDQYVTSMSNNMLIDEDDLSVFLEWNGANRKTLKPITGKVETKRFGDPEKGKTEDKEDDEDEKLRVNKSVEEMLNLVESGTESLNSLVKSIRRSDPLECEAVIDALTDINEDLLSANMKAFALDIAVTLGGTLLDLADEDEDDEYDEE